MPSTSQPTRHRLREGVSSAARVADLGARGPATGLLEEACARLCRLAARLLDVPVVLVALKDEDHPFLAGSAGLTGTDPEQWWAQSPLSLAVSDQSPEGGPLRVEDLAARELLAADPLHREHGFRALLAIPLHPGPSNFGSLCALSREPRFWADADVELLEDIAESVVTEIHLRGSVRQIRSVEEATANATRRSFVSLIDNIDAVVHERDVQNGRFTFVSKRAEALFGHPIERWTDEPEFWRTVIVHPADRGDAVRAVEAAVAGTAAGTFEYRACTSEGRILWIRDSLRLVRQDSGAQLLRGVMVDVTPRKEAELELQGRNRLLELLQELTLLANEGDMEEGLRFALERVCRFVGWPVGHVWMRAADGVLSTSGDQIIPSGIWYIADPARYQPFREATETTRFETGRGLPGRVFADSRPAWMSPLATDRTFPRAEGAARAGLRTCFAFPILSERTVLAVVELLTNEEGPPDANLLELAGHVGALLGRVMERRQAESARHAQEERTRLIVETAQDPFIALDDTNAIRDWNPAAARLFGWAPEEVIGRPIVDTIIPERYRAEQERGFAHFLRTGEASLLNRRVEMPALRKDGTEVPVEVTISPVRVGTRWFFNAFLHDISDRLRSEEERARRENLLAETQRLARIGSWEWDIEADTITWSDELHRIFGTDRLSFDPTLEAYLERLPPDDRALAERTIGSALAQPGPFTFDHRVILAEGVERSIRSQGQVVVGPDGRPQRMLGTAQDVTEQTQARARERELMREQAARAEAEAAQERIRGVVESITDAFVAVDRDLRITFVNAAGERLLGGASMELVGRALQEVLPQGAAGAAAACAQAAATGEATELEAYLEKHDAWVEIRVFPSGEGLSLYLHDATDRRRAEEQVRSSEARYRFLADSVPQQIWTADPLGRLDYVNRVVLDYTGRIFQRMLADGWEAVIHPEDLPAASERWRAAVHQSQPFELEARLLDATGNHRWHLCRARCQTSPEGEVIRWYGANTDIHDQKELETARDQAVDDLERVTHLLSSERTNLEMQARELRRFARALEKSNEDLDRFAYVASHDLKAPLRGIANLTEWLVDDLDDKLTEETRGYATLLQNRVQRMEALIDGILQYSRAGRSREEPEHIPIGELVKEVLELLDPPAHFEIRLGPYWPTLRTERTPLQQVFMNLIGNAIKHADGEHPVIEIRLRDEGEDFCEFSVSDNGPGIAPEYHERIFTIFQTLKARDEVEGTGIGLSVVKRTVENQGGQVWVESAVGQGATFSFLWPRHPDARERTLG